MIAIAIIVLFALKFVLFGCLAVDAVRDIFGHMSTTTQEDAQEATAQNEAPFLPVLVMQAVETVMMRPRKTRVSYTTRQVPSFWRNVPLGLGRIATFTFVCLSIMSSVGCSMTVSIDVPFVKEVQSGLRDVDREVRSWSDNKPKAKHGHTAKPPASLAWNIHRAVYKQLLGQ